MELKANELRSGNYVLDIDNDILSISEITKDYVTFDKCNLKSRYSKIKPIPLTEEWLLKFGFIQDTGEPERFFNDIISLTKYKNAWTIEYNNNDFVFEYVHELQNLHFILKKEELKI